MLSYVQYLRKKIHSANHFCKLPIFQTKIACCNTTSRFAKSLKRYDGINDKEQLAELNDL